MPQPNNRPEPSEEDVQYIHDSMDTIIEGYRPIVELDRVTNKVLLALGTVSVTLLGIGSLEMNLVPYSDVTGWFVGSGAAALGGVAAGFIKGTVKAVEVLRDRIIEHHYQQGKLN